MEVIEIPAIDFGTVRVTAGAGYKIFLYEKHLEFIANKIVMTDIINDNPIEHKEDRYWKVLKSFIGGTNVCYEASHYHIMIQTVNGTDLRLFCSSKKEARAAQDKIMNWLVN